MILPHEIVLERVVAAVGENVCDNLLVATPEVAAATGFSVRRTSERTLSEMAREVALKAAEGAGEISAVIAATFSNEVRFPSLAVKTAGMLGLKSSIPAFDVQMACSAYPYALFLAGSIAGSSGGKVLVIDGDVQSRFARDPAVQVVCSDACTASVVSVRPGETRFAFHSAYGEELRCDQTLEMDGFGVFTFVATAVRRMLGDFLAEETQDVDWFVPHQANMYMIRQLARGLGLSEKLLTSGEKFGNTGSSSVPLTIAYRHTERSLAGSRLFLAGFGAGLSASAGFVRLGEDFSAQICDGEIQQTL